MMLTAGISALESSSEVILYTKNPFHQIGDSAPEPPTSMPQKYIAEAIALLA